MENNEAFLGQGWSFPPEFYAGGAQVELVAGEEDIVQSLEILLTTSLGERTMFAAFGCDLRRFMFEEIDQSLINGVQNVISDGLLNNEPRIKVLNVELDVSNAWSGAILISVDYLVRTTNNRYNLVYPFYINEASPQ
jgi:phage baseplate assembly protein W